MTYGTGFDIVPVWARVFNISGKSIGQSCSAFCTSSLQNLSAIGSSHSLSEAVFDLSLALFRLVCSLHALAPPSKIGIGIYLFIFD